MSSFSTRSTEVIRLFTEAHLYGRPTCHTLLRVALYLLKVTHEPCHHLANQVVRATGSSDVIADCSICYIKEGKTSHHGIFIQ